MKRILITGANRGLGLEFTRQLLERGDRVFAARRDPLKSHDLEKLQKKHGEQLSILQLDVRDEDRIVEVVAEVNEQVEGLDLLINNAGMYPRGESFGNLNEATMLDTLHTNTVAPILVTQALTDLLSKGNEPKVVNISSGMGSIARTVGGSYSYRASKAGLNMYSKVLSSDLRSMGITVVVVHPGWVQTDMGGSGGSLSPEQSISEMLKVIDKIGLKDTGRYLQWDGSELPW
jgi:NAD(P)-dependent dehydrogenase (short-subunit alcohol dehydrogenase family)